MRAYRLQIPSGHVWVLPCESSIVQERRLQGKGSRALYKNWELLIPLHVHSLMISMVPPLDVKDISVKLLSTFLQWRVSKVQVLLYSLMWLGCDIA